MRPIVILLVALIAAGCDRQKAEAPQAPEEKVEAAPKGIDRSHQGEPAPAATFRNPDGGASDLTRFRGVPVLVNLWATWCAPCVKELPTLDRLAERHVVDGRLGVIAVSQDMGPQASVKAFLDQHGIRHVGAWHDPEMALTAALGVQVMPTTILYDAAGKEVWRFVGDLDWTGPEAEALLAGLAADGDPAPAQARP